MVRDRPLNGTVSSRCRGTIRSRSGGVNPRATARGPGEARAAPKKRQHGVVRADGARVSAGQYAVRIGHDVWDRGFLERLVARHAVGDAPGKAVLQLHPQAFAAAEHHALAHREPVGHRLVALAERLQARFGSHVQALPSLEDALAQADGMVNTTPVGMAKSISPGS